MTDTERMNSIPNEQGQVIWQTASDMSVLFVNGVDLPHALRTLAMMAEARKVSQHAIDLQFVMEDDDTFTVGLVLEEVPWL